MSTQPTLKVAVVQAAPVLFDAAASVAKACRLTQVAGAAGAHLVLFSEAFMPAYPREFSLGMVVGSRHPDGRKLWQRYWENCIDVPGPMTERLGQAAKKRVRAPGVGVIERDSTYSRGTLFCTLLHFGPDGRVLGKHRKLKPTGAERLIWGEGDGGIELVHCDGLCL